MKNIIKNSIGVALCLSCWALGAFTFEDIHYWVGEGTNQVAIVIDWNKPNSKSSLCWGYRWNGEPRSATQILNEIAEADNRLHAAISTSTWGSSLDALGYDINDNASYFLTNKSTDALDWCSSNPNTHYWSQCFATDTASFDSATWEYYSTGIDGQMLSNEMWYYLKYIDIPRTHVGVTFGQSYNEVVNYFKRKGIKKEEDWISTNIRQELHYFDN